ncbi:WxL domain-containing protein [Lactiplantibacillus paraxiangfangensis]|uniref:WxL domain-containing protein n=1 Tax=Lactiplantibacillus paraxiangfangensis TaxID=3076224 RepID=UPI0030C72D63
MKKAMIGSALFSVVVLLAPMNVQAAGDGTTTGNSGETNAQITFEAANTNIAPVNPNTPSETDTTNPSTSNVTPNKDSKGPALIYVTPQMTFQGADNKTLIDLYQNKSYFATVSKDQPAAKSAEPFDWNSKFVVEVADGRGAAAKWKVKVAGDKLKGGTTPDTIENATMTWPQAIVKNSSQGDLSAKVSKDLTINLGDNAQDILVASQGVGAGVTAAQFNPSDIKLNIPVNSAKPEAYKTTLHWTLADEPQS